MIPKSCDTCSHFFHCSGCHLGEGCQWGGYQEEPEQEHKTIIEFLKELFT